MIRFSEKIIDAKYSSYIVNKALTVLYQMGLNK